MGHPEAVSHLQSIVDSDDLSGTHLTTITERGTPVKRSNFPGRREQRQQQAAERQARYDALTLDEKLQRARRGSKEQRKLITSGKEARATVA